MCVVHIEFSRFDPLGSYYRFVLLWLSICDTIATMSLEPSKLNCDDIGCGFAQKHVRNLRFQRKKGVFFTHTNKPRQLVSWSCVRRWYIIMVGDEDVYNIFICCSCVSFSFFGVLFVRFFMMVLLLAFIWILCERIIMCCRQYSPRSRRM